MEDEPVVEVGQGHRNDEQDEVAAPAIVQVGHHDVQIGHEHDGVDTVVRHATQPGPEALLQTGLGR